MDDVMKMDECETRRKVRPSQGVHLVVDSKFLGGHSALMIPKTERWTRPFWGALAWKGGTWHHGYSSE